MFAVSAAQANELLERSYRQSHPAPDRAVVVDVARGSIEVVNGEPGGEVVFEVVQRVQRSVGGVIERLAADMVPAAFDPARVFPRLAPRYRVGSDEVRLTVADSRGVVFDWDPSLQMAIEVRVTVPRGVALRVRNVGANVALEHDYEGDLDVVSEAGSFVARTVRGDLSVRTFAGSITVTEVTGRSRLRSETGLVLAGRLHGPADLSTSTGQVEVQHALASLKVRGDDALILVGLSAPAPTSLDLHTSVGEIMLQVDRDLPFTLDAATSRIGRVKMRGLEPVIAKGAVNASLLRADFNGGGLTARVRTSGGNIALVGRAPADG